MTTPADHDDLVLRARDGDRRAFQELLQDVIPPLRCAIAARVAHPDMVDEVLQETLLVCVRRLGAYRPEGRFLPWLRGIARNVALEQLRKRSREGTDRLDAALAAEAVAEMEATAAIDVMDDALRRRLRDCLERLSPRARLMLLRRHVDGLPVERLAQQFKESAGAIAAKLKRIRSALRGCIGEVRG